MDIETLNKLNMLKEKIDDAEYNLRHIEDMEDIINNDIDRLIPLGFDEGLKVQVPPHLQARFLDRLREYWEAKRDELKQEFESI